MACLRYVTGNLTGAAAPVPKTLQNESGQRARPVSPWSSPSSFLTVLEGIHCIRVDDPLV